MGDETLDDEGVINGLQKELQFIQAKDGAFTEAEIKRIAQLEEMLRAEPDLRRLLAHLEARQEKEWAELFQEQRVAPRPDFGDEVKNLQDQQSAERERYVREYHDAQRLRDEHREREEERRRCRDQGLEDRPGRGR